MNRRHVMLMAGIGALAATMPLPAAEAAPPSRYLFEDNFDGKAGSAPDYSKWEPALAREDMEDPTFGSCPRTSANTVTIGETCSSTASPISCSAPPRTATPTSAASSSGSTGDAIGTTWEARIKLNCLTPGCWPAWYLANNNPVNGGEVDIMEWYGNGSWAPGTTVHAKLNGGEHVSHTIAPDGGWHTWRTQWDEAGMRFWLDYVDGAQPYFDVPASSLPDWPFNTPGYTLFPILNLAVAGSGGGDPSGGTYPAEMLVDWVRVW